MPTEIKWWGQVGVKLLLKCHGSQTEKQSGDIPWLSQVLRGDWRSGCDRSIKYDINEANPVLLFEMKLNPVIINRLLTDMFRVLSYDKEYVSVKA